MTIISASSTCPCSEQQASWLKLAIAPQAQARLRFAAPGLPGRALLVSEALELVDQSLAQGLRLEMVELAGPGDPLATPDITLQCLRQIRTRYPELAITVSTLGLGLESLLTELVSLDVRLNLLVDAIQPEVVAQIFSWIRPERKTIPLTKVAPLLVAEQAKAIAACRSAGLALTISTTVYPGYNDGHIDELARTIAGLGATTMTLLPFMPCGAEDEPEGQTSTALAELSDLAAQHLTLTPAPLALAGMPQGGHQAGATTSSTLPKPRKGRANVAVLSGNGMDIDLHLGQAIKALIYGPRQDGLACLLEARDLPEPGGGDKRWHQVAETLNDCFVLLAASAGQKPRQILGEQGLPLLISDDNVEGSVDVLFGGGKKGKCKKG